MQKIEITSTPRQIVPKTDHERFITEVIIRMAFSNARVTAWSGNATRYLGTLKAAKHATISGDGWLRCWLVMCPKPFGAQSQIDDMALDQAIETALDEEHTEPVTVQASLGTGHSGKPMILLSVPRNLGGRVGGLEQEECCHPDRARLYMQLDKHIELHLSRIDNGRENLFRTLLSLPLDVYRVRAQELLEEYAQTPSVSVQASLGEKAISLASEVNDVIICLIDVLGRQGSLASTSAACQSGYCVGVREDLDEGEVRRLSFDINADSIPAEAVWVPENLHDTEPGRNGQSCVTFVRGAWGIIIDLARGTLLNDIQWSVDRSSEGGQVLQTKLST